MPIKPRKIKGLLAMLFWVLICLRQAPSHNIRIRGATLPAIQAKRGSCPEFADPRRCHQVQEVARLT